MSLLSLRLLTSNSEITLDPGPPTNLTVKQVSGFRLEFSWFPPSSGLSGVTYRYYERTADYITGGADTTATTRTVGPLLVGAPYFIHVRSTTGTYVSMPATSDTITVKGNYLIKQFTQMCV